MLLNDNDKPRILVSYSTVATPELLILKFSLGNSLLFILGRYKLL